jgi:hypothetical protein
VFASALRTTSYVVLVVGVAAFGAGVVAYKAILEIAQLESVPKNELQELRRAKETSQPPSASAVGCVTGEASEVRSDSAQLTGTPSGPRTKEWFDFGTSEDQLVFSVAALDGIGRVCLLKPSTRYYFRYRTRYEYGSASSDVLPCTGQIRTFVSAAK